ncbi:acyl-CoA synthetase [Thermomonospora catenispora]|uniref:acyl-CoA synthetase n=1 Tax=Thermomonospora catenispora TaxID=2493090 RepID=UPI00111F0939|nr:long-chain fatty acid--CoA ligase [Thermomonospora catenispora]TNY36004.1 long-chain-fatty-acid--CoA ligase [Thermomonospora catenispora]
MRNQGLGSWPARRARKTPHRTALVYEDRRLTYAELHERVTRLAHALRGLGIRRGDRVAYLGPNHPSFLETLFAAGALGAVFVPLNIRLAGPEIAFQLADSGTSVLVYAPSHAELVDGLEGTPSVRERIALAGERPGAHGYEDLLAGAPADPIDEPVSLEETCMIMYTSGTTGRPKGAVLSHGNITWNAINVLVDHDLIADEVALVSAPLFHTAGLNMLTLPVLLKGGCCVLVPSFDPDATLELIERHRITFMFGVPTMFWQVARSPRWAEADLSSVRLMTCGGSPVPPALIEIYAERGLTFLQGYGMTEASPGVLFLDAEHAVSKTGSAGVPHFFSDVRVVGPDMTDVAPGETGEVIVNGPHVMSGYWGLPEETARAFTDGWFHTGDAARIDEDGYAYIVDRIKDMIISGGENIYPAEVEKAILADPDVLDCAVIGVPDPTWGEVGRAVVVPRPGSDLTEQRVLEALAGRLAKYKIPKSVVFTDELPRNAAGKILKSVVRDRYGSTAEPPAKETP